MSRHATGKGVKKLSSYTFPIEPLVVFYHRTLGLSNTTISGQTQTCAIVERLPVSLLLTLTELSTGQPMLIAALLVIICMIQGHAYSRGEQQESAAPFKR